LNQKLRAPRYSLRDQAREVFDDEDEQEFEQNADSFDEDYLTRDDFNLHKLIIAATAPGKVLQLLIIAVRAPSKVLQLFDKIILCHIRILCCIILRK